MKDITISRINTTHPIFQQVWDLREEILRKPLGLSLRNEDLSRDSTNEVFIALHEGKVIGTVFLKPLENNEVQLRAMAVYNEWQGKGVGRLLVKALEEYARQQGSSKIILHSRKVALDFYKSLGYTQYGEEFTEVTIPHYMMEKSLNP